MNAQRHLVTGANGQDGGYLVERLLALGVEVHGTCRTVDATVALRMEHPGVVAHPVDLADGDAIGDIVRAVEPTHVYNLAGNTSVARSWDHPAEAAEVLGAAPIRLMEAAWRLSQTRSEGVRVLQASSAEIFGDAIESPQTERTPHRPITPYGAAKALAHDLVGMYRARGLHASAAILYNHESPRRPEWFVARKIAMGVVAVAEGRQSELRLGNIDVERDWGYAPDYVDAMMRIISQPEPDDYIVATGESHSIRDFVATAFRAIGIDDWERHVVIDPALFRPADPQRLVGDPRRLRGIGWQPSISFEGLVTTMVEAARSGRS